MNQIKNIHEKNLGVQKPIYADNTNNSNNTIITKNNINKNIEDKNYNFINNSI